jgi:hypothetical protein
MHEAISFVDQLDQLCRQITTAIQSSELQVYVMLAIVAVATLFAFPPKDDLDQI